MCVLEAGGGPGWLWRENVDRLPSNPRICFSDFSLGMVREAREALGGDHHFVFATLDAQTIPMPAGRFDIVVANHMLYHVPDLSRTVHELARVLRPGGRLYAATNGLVHLHELHDLIHEFDPRYLGRDPSARLFGLENAADVLGRSFARVEIRRYADALWVTEAGPLADYILSLWDVVEVVGPTRAAELKAFLQAKIEAEGGIHISKDAGLAIGFLK
jgi:SAM-dependent methyltransferase